VILPYVTNSELGVTTFFVISGYLITYLLRREQEKQGTINIPAFYRRRVLRIFPAFYSYLAVITILSVLKIIPLHLDNIVTAGTFLWNYGHYWLHDGNKYGWYIGHFWTLSLEEQFYLLWPAALALLRPKKALLLALTLIVLMPPIRVITYFLDPSSRGQVGMMLHTAADALMFGCVLALGEGTPIFEKLWKYFQNWLIPLITSLFVLVVWPYISVHHRHLSAPFGMTFNGISLAIVLLWLVRNPQSVVGRFLNSPGLVFIGVLSYSLYLWQQLILGPVNGTWTHQFPINLVLCFALGTASYYVIEKPFLALRHRKPMFAFVAADKSQHP